MPGLCGQAIESTEGKEGVVGEDKVVFRCSRPANTVVLTFFSKNCAIFVIINWGGKEGKKEDTK